MGSNESCRVIRCRNRRPFQEGAHSMRKKRNIGGEREADATVPLEQTM